MKTILEFAPIQAFIRKRGKEIREYFGTDPACIICLRPDGIWYGEGLYHWLVQRKKNLVITTMEDDGRDLDESKVKRRKVLIVDNDIVTGTGYKRSMEALRLRKEQLYIKDVKFATYIDRVGLADFSVLKYSPERLWHLEEFDAVDVHIISLLAQNGRISFADIANKVKLSQVAVKNRISTLLKEGILLIRGALNANRFYTMSAGIQIEADSKTVEKLINRFEKKQEVYHLAKRSGRYSLAVGVLGHDIENIQEFVENEVRSFPGVKNLEVLVGELPILPNTIPLKQG